MRCARQVAGGAGARAAHPQPRYVVSAAARGPVVVARPLVSAAAAPAAAPRRRLALPLGGGGAPTAPALGRRIVATAAASGAGAAGSGGSPSPYDPSALDSIYESDPPPSSSSSSQQDPSSPSSGAPGQRQPHESKLLRRPLLLATRLSHTTAAYISLRRRKRWWGKAGGFPRVPVGEANDLPESPTELWSKIIPLGILFASASFCLTILQSLKDAIVIVAAGAETLPFLASFGVLPLSLAFFAYYGAVAKACKDAKKPSRVFALAIAPLVVFYALFAWVLYPLAPALHPLPLMEKVMAAVPVPGLHGLFKMAGYWLYSLFFCAAELWGPVVISVLFWGLANDACTVDEAKSTYPLLAIGANVALVAAGAFIRAVNSWLHSPGAEACAPWLGCVDATTGQADVRLLSLRVLVGAVLATSGVMLAAKAYIDRAIVEPRRRAEAKAKAEAAAAAAAAAGLDAAAAAARALEEDSDSSSKKKKKKKGSFSESMAVLKACPKVRNLALLVVGYGLSHRLFEFVFKNTLRQLYPTVEAYQGALADVATATGVTTLVFMFGSRLIFRRFGWGVAAAITPLVMGAAGAVFFVASAALASAGTGGGAAAIAAAATAAGVAGAVTQVFARSSKYSLFDPSKEMVFILMDSDERARGKAAIDLVAAQAGKTGASWTTSALLLATGSISAAVPFVGALYLVVIATWLAATRQLAGQMKESDREAAERQAALEKEKQEEEREQASALASSSSSPAPPGDAAAAAALSSAAAGNAAHALGNGNGKAPGVGVEAPATTTTNSSAAAA